MKKINNLLCKIGENPEVFVAGAVVVIISKIVTLLLFKLG